MKKSIVLFVLVLCVTTALVLSACASSGVSGSSATAKVPYFTGDGGKGMSLAILAPQGKGIAENQNYLPTLVQGELVSNFSGFSAISVLDRVSLDDQYAELLSGYYDDDAKAGQDLGRLPPTDYIMSGSITKTATGYALQMRISKTADKMTAASYSGTCTFAELDNLSGIRRASLELLEKMGVTPTEQAKTELAGAATQQSVNAQTALAQGIVSQKSGTTVESLIYYYQAAAFDPSLLEAAGRASVMTASITSGNIGADVRNDIQWRKDWLARLEECERYFDNFFKTSSPPYQLLYSTDLVRGKIDYQTETIPLSFGVNLISDPVWFESVKRALQAVWKGLNATGRETDWALAEWPNKTVTNLNPFRGGKKTFAVSAELLNDQGRVIASQNIKMEGSWSFSGTGLIPSESGRQTVNFDAVNAGDISDVLTIRIASVNGVDAQTAAKNGVIQITAPGGYWGSVFRFDKGSITGYGLSNRGEYFNENTTDEDFRRYFGRYGHVGIDGYRKLSERIAEYIGRDGVLVIPDTIWGEPVTSISGGWAGGGNGSNQGAFQRGGFIDMDHSNPLFLTSVIIPNSVTSITSRAFADNSWLTSVTLPANVNLNNAFGNESYLDNTYNSGGKKAGTYVRSKNGRSWSLKK